jgi:hypothetical protein
MSQYRDLHSALKTEVVLSVEGGGVQFKLVRLQSSKDNISFSLHANPNTFSFSGVQAADLLAHLGFQVSPCAFFSVGKCLATFVREDFPLEKFAESFAKVYPTVREAEKLLQDCGFALTRPNRSSLSVDGHTSPQSKEMKQSEDDYFFFKMSWIEGGQNKGWTFHYRPKHIPLSEEMSGVFSFLELLEFQQCPLFDFEPCHYRFFSFEKRSESFFDSNAEYVHRSFDHHRDKFSLGTENLLKADGLLRPFGFEFLPKAKSGATASRSASLAKIQPMVSKPVEIPKFDFDVAVSFAGTERTHAERLASLVKEAGFRVYYDNYYPEQLWGKDLVVFFDDIYRKRSKFCVIFVSQEYLSRMFTNHERKSAQARAIEEKGNEYILPIKVDEIDLPGLQPTVGYLSLKQYDIEKIAEILIKKLNGV